MRSVWESKSVLLSDPLDLLLESVPVQRVLLLVSRDGSLSVGEDFGGGVKLHFGATSVAHEMVLLNADWERRELLLAFVVVGKPLGDPEVIFVSSLLILEVVSKHGQDRLVAGHAGDLVVVDAQAKCDRHLLLTGR